MTTQNETIFADGIYNIRLQDGMVRMELMVLEPDEENNGTSQPIKTKTVVLPPLGFLRSYDTITRLVDMLKEKGLITKADQEKAD